MEVKNINDKNKIIDFVKTLNFFIPDKDYCSHYAYFSNWEIEVIYFENDDSTDIDINITHLKRKIDISINFEDPYLTNNKKSFIKNLKKCNMPKLFLSDVNQFKKGSNKNV